MLALAGVAGLVAPAAALAQEHRHDEPKKVEDGKKKDSDLAASMNPDDPNAAKLYFVPITGQIGRDFALQTMKNMVKDIKEVQPDYIILRIENEWKSPEGEEKNMYSPNDVYGAVHRVDAIAQVITDDIRDDPSWKKKPQVIAWVKKALGPGAFIPFIAPKIYYTSDAIHGGIGYLDHLYDGRGDEVVRQKQYSLRLAWAEGLAIKGGHDPRIMRAMVRMDYSLSYTMVGGKPVFFENITDGENILTDDGDPEAGRADTIEDVLFNRGNDVLTLTTPVAKRIGFIEGVADSVEELAYELGVSRAYRVYRMNPAKIAGAWAKEVSQRRAEFMRLRDENRRIQVNGETVTERNAQRGRLKRNLQAMVDLLVKYRDALLGIESGDPDTIADQIRQRIAQIDQEIRLDKDQPRRR
ncbi:MAG: hypothetical protein K2Q09_12135 [Phycisphaerales bacterium]|nr:hypothetical protein [Phycisphaerales bacterium]